MKLIRFIKNWTLPLAIASGIIVYFIFTQISLLRPIADWYEPHNNQVLPIFMFLVLFVTFCKVDYKRIRPVKWHLWICLQQLLLIGIVFAMAIAPGIHGHTLLLLESTLACVIAPVASASAVVTAKLGGDLEEMTTYTFESNFLSALLIPLCFPLLPHPTNGVDMAFLPLFLKIMGKVSTVLLMPMLVAYVVKHAMPKVHKKIIGIKDFSYYLWGASLVAVTGTTVMNICDAWTHTPLWLLVLIALSSLLVCLLQFAIGRFMGRHFGKTVEAGQGFGQKNTTFAIWVATAFLYPLSSVGPGCYILWQNIINSLQIWLYRRKGLEHAS